MNGALAIRSRKGTQGLANSCTRQGTMSYQRDRCTAGEFLKNKNRLRGIFGNVRFSFLRTNLRCLHFGGKEERGNVRVATA
ncbi:hypothetical protein CEXT_269951 [Caerostris extrusa]|uniref:Uncharacterized protein n=1 Tax=Caerostris extrusa TaxID=172846 RepID=A0AAV4P1V0_CAEEX|nr:hypothetical protein CEXT_269951 [Caerostris extrusa]